jgi:hypothetical protein
MTTPSAPRGPGDHAAGAPPWLAELTARWGEPRANARTTCDIGWEREVWVWFVEHRNHLLTIDAGPAGRWRISAEAHETGDVTLVSVHCRRQAGWPHDVIRRTLVLAGWLHAPAAGFSVPPGQMLICGTGVEVTGSHWQAGTMTYRHGDRDCAHGDPYLVVNR